MNSTNMQQVMVRPPSPVREYTVLTKLLSRALGKIYLYVQFRQNKPGQGSGTYIQRSISTVGHSEGQICIFILYFTEEIFPERPTRIIFFSPFQTSGDIQAIIVANINMIYFDP